MLTVAIPSQLSPTWAAGPYLAANGADLAGASLASPFTATLTDPGTVDEGVKFLLDNVYLGNDSTAPYEWPITTAAGPHELKAKWDSSGVAQVAEAAFTAIDPNATPTPTPTPTPTSTEPPAVMAYGASLDGAHLPLGAFVASVTNPGVVDDGISFLLDNAYLGNDTGSPFEWNITTAALGIRKLKVKWDSAGVRQEIESTFTVYDPNEPTPTPSETVSPNPSPSPTYTFTPGPVQPAKVAVEPGPALKNLWATADNRRAKVEGLYDWSQAGVGGGTVLADDDQYLRPEGTCRITAAELASAYNVHPDDGGDDSAGLQNAIDHIKADCSPTGDYTKMSIITLPKGVLNVTRQISVDADYLRIRGQGSGPGGSRIVFRPDANTLYDKITGDGTRWDLDNMNDEAPDGEGNGGWIWPGRGLFRVQSRAVHEDYQTAYQNAAPNRKDLYEGTVNVHWKAGVKVAQKGSDIGYAARKGDTQVKVAPMSIQDFDATFKVGMMVNVRAANSRKFYEEMKALPTTWDLQNLHMRQQIFVIVGGDPSQGLLTLDRPLEYNVPVDSTSDGSAPIGAVNFSKVSPIVDSVKWVGFENFSFTQDMPNLDKEKAKNNYGNMAPEAAMHGIVFKWAANSWVKGIRAEMTGSHPIVTEEATHLTVVDNYMDGSWNKGKGGNGYFRGSRVWNSLYAGNTARNIRHFTFQWSASGNVAIGNSFDSDLNLHGGYERNNLFELNEVATPYAHRSNNCSANCGNEGDLAADDSQWYPIWWAAGKKAVKWSGSSGPHNVFFNNHLLKQTDRDTNPFLPYYNDRARIYQFGWDSTNKFRHLEQNGQAIADWAHNETKDFTGNRGVVADKTFAGRSLFLDSVSLSGYGGPRPQKLQQSLGCLCWDGTGVRNSALVADPVNTATGSLMEHFTDLQIQGLGENLDWHRTYNSLDELDGPLSRGWTFGYNSSVTKSTITEEGVTSEIVTFRNGTGGRSRFAKDSSGLYKPLDPAITATLTELTDGWLIKNLDGDTLRFNTAGQLLYELDAQEHGVSMQYTAGKLSQVTDHLGQTITVTWGTTGAAADRITQITGSDGNSVAYAYEVTAGEARLTEVTDVTGKKTTFSYDAVTGFVNGITDPLGRTSAVTTYDPVSKRAISQTDAAGAVTTFAWDPTAQTATITFPGGAQRKDVYQDNVLISQIGPDGRARDLYYGPNNEVIAENTAGQAITNNTYDERGNLLKRTLPAESGDSSPPFEEWTYDSANRITSHIDPLGKATGYDYDGAGRLVTTTYPGGATATLTYTANGQVHTSADALGRTTTYAYDADGNKTRRTGPGGKVTTWTYDDAHNKLTETSPLGNLPGADPTDHTTTWTYDAAGRVLIQSDPLGRTTTNTYDAAGQLTQTQAPDGGLTKYTYTANGKILTETDPLNRVTEHIYDTAGRKVTTIAPDGAKTTYSYDGTTGRVASITGPAGNADGASAEDKRRDTVTHVYDAAGRVIQTRQVDPRDSAAYLITATTYDVAGRPVTSTTPDGAVTRTTYDDAGRTVKTDAPNGVTTLTYDDRGREKTRTSGGVTVTNTYDAAGQLLKAQTGGGAITTHTYNADGLLTSTVDPRGNAPGANPDDYRTTFTYDAEGHRVKVTDPLGRETSAAYDSVGQTISTTDAAGNVTGYGHDVMGNVTSVTTASGAVTGYGYDKAGQVRTVTSPRGGVTTSTYDASGRIKTETAPDGKVTQYNYDAAGNLVTKTLPSGEITYGYDGLGRMLTVDHSDGSGDLTYTYDAVGRPTQITRTAAGSPLTATLTYDKAGHVTGVTRGTDTFAYDWDEHGKLVKRVLPDAREQSYAYDADGRLASTTLSAPAATTLSYGYDAAGALTTVDRGDGPTTTRTYNRAGQLTSLIHAKNSTTLMSQEVTWNAMGVPAQITSTRGLTAGTSIYSYDADGRLTKSCQTVGGECAGTSPYIAYEYDSNGNRTRTSTYAGSGDPANVHTTYDVADRPLQESATAGGPATTTYVYDDNGSLHEQITAAGTTTHVYGLDGNLQSVTLPDARIVTYAYDESGNRIARAVNGTADRAWTWDNLGSLATRTAERDATGAVTHQWWADPTSSLGAPLGDTSATGDLTWLLDDYQGSITDTAAVTGGTLALTGTGLFAPFGEETSVTGAYAANPFRFHGQYLDELTGLYDVRARDYDPGTGRFTAVDPVRPKAGSAFAQTYHYGFNNPTVLTDPSGEWFAIAVRVGLLMFSALYAYTATQAVYDAPSVTLPTIHWDDTRASRLWDNFTGWVNQRGASDAPTEAEIAAAAVAALNAAVDAAWEKKLPKCKDEESGGKKKRKKKDDGETYYRGMKEAHFKTLVTTDRMPPSNKETFISPTLEYVQRGYDGTIVEFTLKKGTTNALAAIGVSDGSPGVAARYPEMPPSFSGWKKSRALFKEERGQINIGLGNGRALDIFNNGILSFEEVAR